MNIIIINIASIPCYFRNNSLRNYKLTLLGLKSVKCTLNKEIEGILCEHLHARGCVRDLQLLL